MALPQYTFDSIPTEAEFNAFLRPKFDRNEGQEEFPGSLTRLRDDALSNDPTQIKGRWQAFEGALRVSAGSGRTINYNGGVVQDIQMQSLSIAPGSLLLPDNATTLVFIDQGGVVRSGTLLPVMALPMARVTTLGGVITTVASLLPRYTILPRPEAIKVFGGSGDQGDLIVSGSTTLGEAEYWYRNLTVTSTGVLNFSTARVYVQGDVLIQGTINVGAPLLGGAGFVVQFANAGIQSAGTGQGSARGFAAGGPYNYALSPNGSGGATGTANGTAGAWSVTIGEGGNGGGSLIIEAGGTITVTGAIVCRGTNAVTSIVNNSSGLNAASGGGAGSGGLIMLKSLVAIVAPGTLDVRGGNGAGAAFAATGFRSLGGGGGGGGQIALLAPSVNTTGGSALMTGGTPGATVNNGAANLGGGGGGGFGGAGGSGGDPPGAGITGRQIIRILRPTI